MLTANATIMGQMRQIWNFCDSLNADTTIFGIIVSNIHEEHGAKHQLLCTIKNSFRRGYTLPISLGVTHVFEKSACGKHFDHAHTHP